MPVLAEIHGFMYTTSTDLYEQQRIVPMAWIGKSALLGLVAVTLATTSLESQPTCPSGDAGARERVIELLTSPSLGAHRATYGIDGVNASTLRLLDDARDAAVCQWLNDSVDAGTYGRKVYYTAGGYYFVSIAYVPPAGKIPLVQLPVIIMTNGFQVVDVIGM